MTVLLDVRQDETVHENLGAVIVLPNIMSPFALRQHESWLFMGHVEVTFAEGGAEIHVRTLDSYKNDEQDGQTALEVLYCLLGGELFHQVFDKTPFGTSRKVGVSFAEYDQLKAILLRAMYASVNARNFLNPMVYS